MPPEQTDYSKIENAVFAVGLGLVVSGAVVIGLVETILGSTHLTQRIPGLGVVVVHTSYAPRLRASIIAVGFPLLFGLSCYRIGQDHL